MRSTLPAPPTRPELAPPSPSLVRLEQAFTSTAAAPATAHQLVEVQPKAPQSPATIGARLALVILAALFIGIPLFLGRTPPNPARGAARFLALHSPLPDSWRLGLARAVRDHWGVLAASTAAASAWIGSITLVLLLITRPRSQSEIVCRIAGFEFDANDFCRGILITGATGCGKSACGIVRIVHELCQNCPKVVDPVTKKVTKYPWGGAVFDYKGELPDDLRPTFRAYNREDDLIVLRSRPLDAPHPWVPDARLNLLGDDTIPPLDYANILCDAAMIAEGKSGGSDGNPFFPLAAKDAMAKAITLCRAITLLQAKALHDLAPSQRFHPRIDRLYHMLMDRDSFDEAMASAGIYAPYTAPRPPSTSAEEDKRQPRFQQSKILLAKNPAAAAVREALTLMERSYFSIEGETFNSVQRTALNYLAPYMEPDILAVFSTDSTVSISDLNFGKIIVISMPMLYQAQRTYIQIILSQMLFAHAKRRFDIPPAERRKLPINVLFVDEFQKMANNQYGDMDVTRGARFTCVLGTQGQDSLYPVLGKERATVQLNNVRTRIIGQSAGAAAAEADADFLGKGEFVEISTSSGGGGPTSVSRRREIRHKFEAHKLAQLPKYNFIVTHPDGRARQLILPPLTPDGEIQKWWWSSEVMRSNPIALLSLKFRYTIARWLGRTVKE